MTVQTQADVKNSHEGRCTPSALARAKNPSTGLEGHADPMLASMRPEELRMVMDSLGHTSQSALARSIGVDRSTVSLWMEGRIGVPRPVAKLLRLLQAQEEQEMQTGP